MQSVVKSEEMKKIDVLASKKLSIPSIILMENAGRCFVEIMQKSYGTLSQKNILIICGKGNNGGDGFVIARYLLKEQANVTVILMEKESLIQKDAKINYEILKKHGFENLTLISEKNKNYKKQRWDFIIDAIFGASFQGKLQGKYFSIVQWLNKQSAKILSVDVPSGVNATTGEVKGIAVQAHHTITMAAPKVGFFLNNAPNYIGKLDIADIHIPSNIISKNFSNIFMIEECDVTSSLSKKLRTAHKYSVGKVLVLAGSKGFSGAALLASQSAMKTGCGAVVLGVPSTIFPAISKRTLEVMPFELSSTKEGTLSENQIPELQKKIFWADVVLIGPGLSQNSETQKFIYQLLSTISKPIVLDADGLNAIANNINLLLTRKTSSLILTPHLGEFSRLVKMDVNEIQKNIIAIAKKFAAQYNVVLVLKGPHTLIANPKGKLYINSSGNSGMATAGSGDVLSGIIASLVAQGNDILTASINGVYLHGKAGDLAKDQIGERGMIASDIMTYTPVAIMQLLITDFYKEKRIE